MNELEKPKGLGRLTNRDIINGIAIDPLKKLQVFDEDTYEDLILVWANSYLMKKYEKVFQIGGSGDKGRDICTYIDYKNKIWELYQCKYYQNKLAPSDIYLELGKLCYYTFKKEYNLPIKYYFMSPQGLGPTLIDLIGKPDKLKESLFINWDQYCKSKITNTQLIELSKDLNNHINTIDFSIFDWVEPIDFINKFRETPYYSMYFGGGLQYSRSITPKAASTIALEEIVYVRQLFEAYSDYTKEEIKDISDLKSMTELLDHFNRQRDSFYIADSLRQFSREVLPPESDAFNELKEEVYSLIIDVLTKSFPDGYCRLKETIQEAKRGSFTSNPLHQEIRTQDKEGLCHHLANENRIRWVKK